MIRAHLGALLYMATPSSVTTQPAALHSLTRLPKIMSEMMMESTTLTLPSTCSAASKEGSKEVNR